MDQSVNESTHQTQESVRLNGSSCMHVCACACHRLSVLIAYLQMSEHNCIVTVVHIDICTYVGMCAYKQLDKSLVNTHVHTHIHIFVCAYVHMHVCSSNAVKCYTKFTYQFTYVRTYVYTCLHIRLCLATHARTHILKRSQVRNHTEW